MSNPPEISCDTTFIAMMGLEEAINSGKIPDQVMRWFALDCVKRALERECEAEEELEKDPAYVRQLPSTNPLVGGGL